MRMKRRYIVIAIAVAVVVGGVIFEFPGHKAQASRQDSSPIPTVAVALATRGPIRSSITLSGTFRPYQEVDVHAKVAGYIRHIYVDVGDKVKEKQILAILEVPELNAQVAGAKPTFSAARMRSAGRSKTSNERNQPTQPTIPPTHG